MQTMETGWHEGLGIKVARTIDGESQEQLAARLGWNYMKVSRLERGDTTLTVPELRHLMRIQSRSAAWYLDGPNPGYIDLFSDNPHVARSSSIVSAALIEEWANTLPIEVQQAS